MTIWIKVPDGWRCKLCPDKVIPKGQGTKKEAHEVYHIKKNKNGG